MEIIEVIFMSETAVKDKKVNITIPCIVKPTEPNQIPLLIFWITRVFQIGEKFYTTLDSLLILDQCKDYVLKNLDIISAISKFPKENLKAFCQELDNKFWDNREQFLNLLNCKIEMPKNKGSFGETEGDISLFPNEKLFQNENGNVGVGFPTIYEFVMREKEGKLEFSQETIDAYKNLPDEVNFYEHEISIKNLPAEELQSWEADKIIENIDYLSNKQLLELNTKRIEYLYYLKNKSDNFNDDIKQKVFARFVESDSNFIKSFTAKEFIDWNNYINIESFSDLNIDVIIGLVEHLVNNENLSVNFVKKIFYSLHGLLQSDYNVHLAQIGTINGDPKLWRIFNENLFAKMVQYQNYIDFKKIFIFSTPSDSHAVSQVKQNVNGIGDSVTKNFLEFLYKGREQKNFDNLLRNEYFSKLIFQVLNIPLNEILNFYLPWSGKNRIAEFPSKYVHDLIKDIDSLAPQQKSLAYEILITKVNVNYELINNLPIEIIYTNLNQIKSKALANLPKERFEKLIDYFVKNGTIGFGGFRKILVGLYDKFNDVEPSKIFDLMMCLPINDDSQKSGNINKLKQYFNDLFSKGKVNSTWRLKFFQYIFSKKWEMNDLVLDTLPQIVNYFSVEQIYDNLDKIQKHGLIDENFTKCNELQKFIYAKGKIQKITIWQEILKNNIMLIINLHDYEKTLELIKNSDTEFLKSIAQNIKPDKLFKFNDFVNIAYNENKNILQEMLKSNPDLVNDIDDNEIFINLMMKDEQIDRELLGIVSSKINRNKFSQLVRWSKNQTNLPSHVELIFSQFAEKNLSNDDNYWYTFDLDSRIIVLNAYFNHINNEIPQDIVKNYYYLKSICLKQ